MLVHRAGPGGSRVFLLAAVLAAASVVTGCRTVPEGDAPPRLDAGRLTSLLDAGTALGVVEWTPGPPAPGDGDLVARVGECGAVTAAGLGFLGFDLSDDPPPGTRGVLAVGTSTPDGGRLVAARLVGDEGETR